MVGGEAAQPPEYVGGVAPEHAAQVVHLVDHDVAEAGQERVPQPVMGKDPVVEHVGVGEDHVGRVPHPPPAVGRQVSVVGGMPSTPVYPAGEASRAGPGQEPWWGTPVGRCGWGPRGCARLSGSGSRGSSRRPYPKPRTTWGSLPDPADRPGLVRVQPGDTQIRQPFG